jgi:hypothetical protein
VFWTGKELATNNPVFFVSKVEEGIINIVERTFKDKKAMGQTVTLSSGEKFTVPEMVAINRDPLPVTNDGYFVLPQRAGENMTNPGMNSITGAAMNAMNVLAHDPLRVNLQRAYLLEQGIDLVKEYVFAVRDLPGKGMSFILNITMTQMARAVRSAQVRASRWPIPEDFKSTDVGTTCSNL